MYPDSTVCNICIIRDVLIFHRFTNIGGPSFYVSFLGQNSLSAPLKIQVSFDSNVDWTLARPTLLFWDTHQGVWREVNETCTDTPTTVDWVSYTLTTYMCSTSDTSRRKRQNTNTTAFLERATHFVVGQIGSTIINTAPRLQLPDTPTDIQQNPVVYKVDLSTMYTDDEMDSVLFHLLTAPQLGTVELSTSGQLKYTPCLYCIGLEELTVRIIENSPEVDVPLSDSGMLLLNIVNKNDPPNRFLYDNLTEGTILPGSEITVFLDNNRTAFTSVALIGGYDFDGFHDDLSVRITGARRGTASSELWLDVVAVSESLPVQWPANSSEMTYRGYMTFIGVNITYLPSDPAYVGQDSLTVSIQDRGALFSNPLRISVTMFDSPCVNGGRCRDPIGRNCSCDCPSGYLGNYCEISPPAVVSGGGVCRYACMTVYNTHLWEHVGICVLLYQKCTSHTYFIQTYVYLLHTKGLLGICTYTQMHIIRAHPCKHIHNIYYAYLHFVYHIYTVYYMYVCILCIRT